jgi:hypothetical protein
MHAIKVVMAAKKNVTTKVSIIMKAIATTKMALEVAIHVAKAMELLQIELRRRKIANAQLGFFESSSKLLQTFVALKNQT